MVVFRDRAGQSIGTDPFLTKVASPMDISSFFIDRQRRVRYNRSTILLRKLQKHTTRDIMSRTES